MCANSIRHVFPSALVACRNKTLSQISSKLMCWQTTNFILPFQSTVSNVPQLSQLSAVPLPHLQQKVVCPKTRGGQSSDLLENPLGLLASCMKCESWVIHRLGSRSILKKRGFFSLPPPCCGYVVSKELMEMLSATSPRSQSFSRDGEHQLLTFMWEAGLWKQKEIKLFGLPVAALASSSFSRSGQAMRASGHMLPSISQGHQKQAPLTDPSCPLGKLIPTFLEKGILKAVPFSLILITISADVGISAKNWEKPLHHLYPRAHLDSDPIGNETEPVFCSRNTGSILEHQLCFRASKQHENFAKCSSLWWCAIKKVLGGKSRILALPIPILEAICLQQQRLVVMCKKFGIFYAELLIVSLQISKTCQN